MRLLLLAFLLPAAALAQTPDTLVVTVVSAEGTPLDFADVFLPDLLKSDRTGPDGIARIAGVPHGDHHLAVTPFRRGALPLLQTVRVGQGVTSFRVTIDGEISERERPLDSLRAASARRAARHPAHPSASGRLAGVVTDDTGETLPGAIVFLPDIQRGAATDMDGTYTILGIPVGTYEVQFSSVGYGSQSIEDVAISRDRTRQLDITLIAGQLEFVISCFVSCYERPLFSNDAYSPRIVSGYDLENRPDRFADGPTGALTRAFAR